MQTNPTPLTAAQVALRLGVSTRTVARWANEGKLTATRTLGGHRRYDPQEIADVVRYGNSDYTERAS